MSFPRYPAYKPSGVEWLGEVPEHWDVIRLKNVLRCRITDGPHTTPEFIEEGIPFLSVDGIQDGELRFEECRYISVADHEEFSRKAQPARDDILMGKAASTGKIARVKTDHAFSIWSPLALIRVDNRLSSPSYYEQFLKSISSQAQIDVLCTSNTQKNISMDDISKLVVARPPLEEQRRIATFLDRESAKIDALIAEQQRLIELLQEKRQAVISQAVTKGLNQDAPMKDSGVEWLGQVPEHWKVIQLKWLSPVKRGASPRPIDDPIYFDEEGEYAWVRISDVTESSGRLKATTQRLSALGSDLSVKVEPGSLFLSIAGSVGKPCISEIKACIHDGFVFFPDLHFAPEYLFLVFETGACFGGLGKLGTQLNLNTDTIGSIHIALPPQNEIEDIIQHCSLQVGKLQDLCESANHSIQILQERRSALISAAVTGQIDVRGLAPETSGA